MFQYQSNEHNKFAVCSTLLENRNRMIDDSSGNKWVTQNLSNSDLLFFFFFLGSYFPSIKCTIIKCSISFGTFIYFIQILYSL